jgi:multimeric flavodoxin WrbA
LPPQRRGWPLHQTTMQRRILFLLASTRVDGNTEQLARRAAAALSSQVEQRWLRLDELPLAPFVDIRHDAGVYPEPEGNARALLDATLWATDLVLVAPTYWYSLPAAAKLYLDYWSAWMRVPGLQFRAALKGRRLFGITVNSDAPESGAEGSAPLVAALSLSADYMEMDWRGALVGHGSRPGDVLADGGALEAAKTFLIVA